MTNKVLRPKSPKAMYSIYLERKEESQILREKIKTTAKDEEEISYRKSYVAVNTSKHAKDQYY